MTYSILSAYKVEMDGTRTSDYRQAFAAFCHLRGAIICFLVRWDAPGVFTVLEGAE
jgi:hypothetical protein